MNVDRTSEIMIIFLYMYIAIILCIKNEATLTRVCKMATLSILTKGDMHMFSARICTSNLSCEAVTSKTQN